MFTGDSLGDDSMPRMSLLLTGGDRTSKMNQNVKRLNTDGVMSILEKEPEMRTTLEARKIAHTISHFEFFAPLAEDIEALVHLCKRISIKRLPKYEYLFMKGDPGDYFYVLYEGAMSITIHTTAHSKGAPAVEKVLKLLHKGDTFGETALKAKHGKRGANAKGGDQDSILLVIQCADFLAIEEEHEVFMTAQKMALLSRSPAFKGFGKSHLKLIQAKMNVKKYEANTVICNRGDENYDLCLIKKGMVKVLKR